LTVLTFGTGETAKAAHLVRKYAEHLLTLADVHGLAIMGERTFRECWSTDRHMTLTGVPLAT
jgi:hypothetical protein